MKNICVNVSEMGLNPEKLCEMIETLEKEVELHSIVVQYDGKKIIEGAWDPFTLEDPQMMHSLSKIGTAICIGYKNHIKGPKKRTEEDDERFTQSFERLIQKALDNC